MSTSFPLTARRGFVTGAVVVGGLIGAIAVLKVFLEQSMTMSGGVLIALFSVAWVLFSRGAWWFTVPTALCLGGMLNIGFKIYSYEFGFFLALIAAIPIALTRGSGRSRTSFLPPALVALGVYLAFRMGVDLYMGLMDGYPLGNIFRVYVIGLWPLVFAIPFVFLGSTKHLKTALWIMYSAALVRCLLGVAGYVFPQVLPMTGISVVLPGLYSEGIELRASGIWLLYLALSSWSLSGRRIHWVHSSMVVFAVACVLLGGGRGSLGLMVGLLGIWMCVERRFVMLGVCAVSLAAIAVTLNVNPDLIYGFPDRLQRMLSILMVRSPFLDVHRIIEGSDEWHRQLATIAIARWTDSPVSFLFGHRLIPFSAGMDPMAQSFYDVMKTAADLGYYEAGLWTTLAVTGAVGGILYGLTLWKLSKPLWGWVRKERVRSIAGAFGFMALSSTLLWLVFGWIMGHFPSEQIVMLLIARAAYEDQKSAVAGTGTT